MANPGVLWIGPSGWSYADWGGVVYPARRPAGFAPLAFIGKLFNAVEVNSSFYAIPAARTVAAWPAQTPRPFRFAVKVFQGFTHTRDEPPSPTTAQAFCEAIEPLRVAGVLGPLLFQFPWSFRHRHESVEWLRRVTGLFESYTRFVEVRHSSWAAPAALDALRGVGGFCNIDQPALRDCLSPSAHVFGNAAYARLHGRNAANWFAENQPAFERYNYLYDDAELREWVQKIAQMRAIAAETYVFTNNHYRGQGVVNALELRHALGLPAVELPPGLVSAYPRLASIGKGPRQMELF
ncbi:MAG: DUF72 domain-containing protein [Phycisphaerae bacterium]